MEVHCVWTNSELTNNCIYGSLTGEHFLIRATERFFRGVLHPHLLGVCCPNHFFLPIDGGGDMS